MSTVANRDGDAGDSLDSLDAGAEGAKPPAACERCAEGGAAGRDKAPKPLLVRLLWRALGFVKTGLEVTVIAAALWLFVFQVSVVSGHSMDRSLEPGDRLVVDKLTCRWMSIRRFDVVVFEAGDRGVDYVKRVVGLQGETIELREGELYVDGELVEQEFDFVKSVCSYGPEEVPEGSYFVLGDNRPCSRDSRDFGPVSKGQIKGVARLRVYPFGRAGSVR